MKKLFVLSIMILFITSCGSSGGGGGDSAVVQASPTVSNLTEGHYVMKAFEVQWRNGGSVNSANVDNSRWSGQMNIFANGYMLQKFVLDGKVTMGESWFVNVADSRTLYAYSGNCRYQIDYWWDNPILTTQVNFPCGLDFKEKDTWKKVSDSTKNFTNAMTDPIDMMQEFEDTETLGNTSGSGVLVGVFF